MDYQNAFDPMHIKFNPKEDIAVLPYSSGTTGLPKGVMLTHYNLVANMINNRHPAFAGNTQPTEKSPAVFLAYLPFYHVYGLSIVMCCVLATGVSIVTLPKFSPHTFLEAIEKYKVTGMSMVPPTVIFMAKSPLVKKYDLSSLQRVGCGAAPLGKDIEGQFSTKNNICIRQGYGLTETGPTVLCQPEHGQKLGSAGILVPNTEVLVVDIDTKKVLGPNQKGELWIRGPQVMKGYLNKPKATKDALDEQGWFHSGDIGYYDEDEHFFIVDRLKELIKFKGYQVPPAELEALLLSHPAVADVGVTGIPDSSGGEVPKAFVVRKSGQSVSEKELMSFVKEYLAPYKQLRGGVEFISEIPKTQTGKILRRYLKQMATGTSSKL